MVRLVRGKGARKEVIELACMGAVLRRLRSEGGMQHLPGYRRCADPSLARRAST